MKRDDVYIFSRGGLREVDRLAVEEFRIPILSLMENAGRAVAEAVIRATKGKGRVLVVCGPGNNGGDGLVAARFLHNAGMEVLVLLVAERASFRDAAGVQLGILDAMRLSVEVVTAGHAELRDWVVEGEPGDVVVDAIFGTGLSREISGISREVVEALNKSGRMIFAVDIPSGVDCDTGAVLGVAVRAAETVSFCGLKKGFGAAKQYTGRVTVADIGVPRELLKRCNAN